MSVNDNTSPLDDEKVIQLDECRLGDPHLAGEAQCMGCGYRWAAVGPVGLYALECPRCGMEKGAWTTAVLPQEGEPSWTCHCGCHFMVLLPDRIMCAHCGKPQHGMWDEPQGVA